MSTSTAPVATTASTITTSTSSTSSTNYVPHIALGYAVAIALAILVIISAILLVSYICCRNFRSRHASGGAASTAPSDGIILPRVIFVADGEEDEEHGDERSTAGLNHAVINSYPKFQFNRDHSGLNGQDATCSICLSEYKDSEMLRMMPDCRHYFHQCCIDSWLKLNGSCPVCRNSPLPTPLSTPLSEIVPLSHYADDGRRR